MPLTPEDVSNKRFTPVRLREGYDMGEVDQFLDEVEAELSRLTQENEQLQSQLATTQNGHGSPTHAADETSTAPAVQERQPEPVASTSGSTTTEPDPTPAPGSAAAPAPEPDLEAAQPVETLQVTTVADASSAAVRLLEIATRNAGELVGEAKEEAERILGEARTSAERVEADSRNRSQMIDAETAERRAQLFGDLDKERERLSGEVDSLRTFEREYRARLKSYFEQQLAALDGAGEAGSLDGAGEPQPRSRLKALLGDDGDKQA